MACSSASPEHTLGTNSFLSVEDYEKPFLISPHNTFSFGFYEVGHNAFSLSIWFTNTIDKTVVWVANPNSPVNGHGSKLSFYLEGNLVLSDGKGSIVWDNKMMSGQGSRVALLETGNLVITDSKDCVVWQSFDSPTDTLLPLQLLTKDKRLVSGYYSLYYDSDNVLQLKYDGPEISSIYWPNPYYSIFDNGRTTYNSSRIGILDNTGHFMSSDGLNIVASDSGLGINRRLTINQDGNLRLYSLNTLEKKWTVTWEAMPQICGVHGLCGGNSICEYSPSPRCSCALDHFMFVEMQQVDFHGFDLAYNMPISLEGCEKICSAMNSCVAYSYRAGHGRCFAKGQLFNGRKTPSITGSTYFKIPKTTNILIVKQYGLTCRHNNTHEMHQHLEKLLYYYICAAIFGGLELIFITIAYVFLQSKQNIPKSVLDGYEFMTEHFKKFSYRELKEATGNFKEELGRGGSGVFYRGVLDKKRVVAVKRLTNATKAEEEFQAEISVIGRINHINLVRTWGFCSEGKHKLLVYDYVENESLEKHLFESIDAKRFLRWSQRFIIALGTARGLAYLHHECLEWVVHCDMKPENILLTQDFEVKIADFGLAKLSKRSCSSLQLSHMRGTIGYMAPEWALSLPINAKVDVFSYGIVLLEIVMGARISSQTTTEGEKLDLTQILEALKQLVASGDVTHIVDAKLHGQFNHLQAMEMVKISLSCIGERNKRPTMDEIVKALMACSCEDKYI
ncbi:putative receptor protein kinase ZmPK1 [Oryza brachyantha]|uniref:putative receptor protein kinase ZmPK1 n=1 Tax=Oryza brachyantha TaxID=4533 RepID=UPI0007762FEA|nr:putative receptor protein kinase ZmPK1 [Oryza brachyantha]